METFGKRVRRLRRSADLTQQELAEKLGVSEPTIRAWESGRAKPRYDRLCEVADFFGVTPEELVGDHSSTSPLLVTELPWDERELLETYRSLPADMKLRFLTDARELARNPRGGGSS